MKTKVKQFSKPVACFLMGMMLIVSTFITGAVTDTNKDSAKASSLSESTDSAAANTALTAKTDKKDKIRTGADAKMRTGATYYLHIGTDPNPNNWNKYVTSTSTTFTITPASLGLSKFSTSTNYYVGISDTTSVTNMFSQGGSSAVGSYSSPISSASPQGYNVDNRQYHFAYFSLSSSSVSSVTVSVSGETNTTYTFSATSSSYTISYNTPSNGSFTTKPTSGTSGNTITVVATPYTGYQISTFTVTNSSTSATITTSGSGNTRTFTMPSANVSVSVTFSLINYTITKTATNCGITAAANATYNSTVNFTVTPNTDYALKTLTVKQGTTSIQYTSTGENTYRFTMPAGNVTITANCVTTVGTAEIYFKSATAWVYHPYISVNDGAEQAMTLGNTPVYLDNGPKAEGVKPKSDTGSLRYAWYKVSLSGLDTSKPVKFKIRGQDTYMEATGSFTIGSGSTVYLGCDNLMEGSTLVDLSSESAAVRDFYDTPLHMVATAAEKAAING